VTIFVLDGEDTIDGEERSSGDLMDIVDTQSIGAAIQNMLLAALDRGLGTLWICDVFYATEELCEWLGDNHLMIAAVSVGYPDEAPAPRPRMSVDEVTRWL
jgi:nitroreductase